MKCPAYTCACTFCFMAIHRPVRCQLRSHRPLGICSRRHGWGAAAWGHDPAAMHGLPGCVQAVGAEHYERFQLAPASEGFARWAEQWVDWWGAGGGCGFGWGAGLPGPGCLPSAYLPQLWRAHPPLHPLLPQLWACTTHSPSILRG